MFLLVQDEKYKMRNAIEQGDAQTIENLITRNGIDINAVIWVSTIITSYNFTCINYYYL